MFLLKFMFSPSGRVSRTEYLLFSIFFYAYNNAGLWLLPHLGSLSPKLQLACMGLILGAMLVFLVSLVIIIIKRFHDLGQSGWFALLLLVPLVDIYYLIKLAFFGSKDSDNAYGRPPAFDLPLAFFLGLWFAFFFGAGYLEHSAAGDKNGARSRVMDFVKPKEQEETPVPEPAAPNPQETIKALLQLRQTAERGDAEAQYNLASLYLIGGSGAPKDEKAAAEWLAKAAAQGLPKAQYNLGIFYAKGQGVAQDDAEACFWLTLASSAGYKVPAGEQDYRATAIARLAPEKLTACLQRVKAWEPPK